MQIPAVMFIEMALDMLPGAHSARTVKEFRALGVARLEKARTRVGVGHSDIEVGYLLGLETARALLATMPAAVQAGIEL